MDGVQMKLWPRKNKNDDLADAMTPYQDNASLAFSNQLKQRTTFIKKIALNTINDIQFIQDEIQDGNLTIIDVAGFVTSGEFDILELKRSIEQIRGTCKKLGGTLARLGDRFLLATPNENLQLAP